RYVERLKSRIVSSLENSFFLDCALSQTFSERVSKISGLNHLKNTYVNALLDYGVVENLLVDNKGNLSLPYPAQNVVVGLEYDFELETLNIESDATLGLSKVINQIEVKILNSREDFFIINDDNTLCQNSRSHKSVNEPEMLFDKDVEFCPLSNSALQKSVRIFQKYPLPLNILAINATLSIEEVEAL
ncbi:hypothetical protein IJ531_05070, partial [bacterium]|nr:hypothetical protein [bacterium]